jgi:hypothetical protein
VKKELVILLLLLLPLVLDAAPTAARSSGAAPGIGVDSASVTGVAAAGEHEGFPAQWSFEAFVGDFRGGPVDGLTGVMRRSGFANEDCWWACPGYPMKEFGSIWNDRQFWGVARRRVGQGPFLLGLAGGVPQLGAVQGHHLSEDPALLGSIYLHATTKAATLALMFWYEGAPRQSFWTARVGAGPSLNRLSVRIDEEVIGHGVDAFRRTYAKTSLGYVVDFTLCVPRVAPVYAAALAQYRETGSVSVGGWTRRFNSVDIYTFNRAKIRMSHAFFALGVGGRF